ncbi:hypothetical protein PR202_ga01737 [Eleusine coracana subsp. coracana]|uniref:BHLH domain-containing protein n=1 Tax=Eleusine coracana subsp. coracana TaxID=191504 RepID=A0AAV5BI12_ELECO|nr:hypothetical protein PR202_ga01050 [Eleusine coracana subsp. coracana]GJM85928.1 hypothetical protein PR202_ga01737 [Eleusine coracana subsp. coracana]
MGGFVDPFTPAPAWPHDLAFAGSSWSGNDASSLADSAELEFLLQNGSSSALLSGRAKGTMSPLELHEQFLQEQLQSHLTHGLNFEVDSEVERALMAGTLGSTLNAPMLCSSNESSGSEESGLPRFLLGEQQVPAPAAWSSAFSQITSLVGEETSQSFGFGKVGNGDLLHEACNSDGKKFPQLGNVPSASLQLHVSDHKHISLNQPLSYNMFLLVMVILHAICLQDDAKHNTAKMLSFAPGQQLDTNFDNLEIGQKEFSGLHHLNLSSLVSGQLSAFNATGAALSPKQSNEARSGINGLTATSITRSEAPNGNIAPANGAPKPRVRARRGQATDPHSIAERVRREKISDRMKNLQELVPNSNRTDKASMLDEIIDYVKFLQLQVKVLSMSRLGATEAVVPLLTESQTESSGLLLSPKSESRKAGEDVVEQSELRDGAAFEQEVAQLMENNMTTAMQYLQSKGLCLMPIALASAISDQKSMSSVAVRPGNGGTVDDGGKGDAKKVPGVLKPFSIAKEMRSRA